MAQLVKLKRSSVSGKVPLTTDLQLGELAVNTFDGKLYTKKDNGTQSVVEIGAGGGSVAVDATTTDIFSVASGTISADDPGADRLVFWDDSASKLTHLSIGSGLTISGTTLSANQNYYYTATAPTGAQAGALWVHQNTGAFYINVDDGNSAQWIGVGGASGTSGESVISQNAQVISTNLTLTTGYNGISAGPVEVAATYTVTIPANSSWTVL